MRDAALSPVRTESRPWRAGLIIGVMVLTFVLLLAPLAVVFAEALRNGLFAAITSLSERDALSAIHLTLLVAAIAVPPRNQPSQAFAPRNSAWLNPALEATAPIRMNIGTTDRS